MAEPIDPPGRIVQSGLALVGEIDVAVAGDMQIVASAEGFGIARRQHLPHPPRPRIEFHDAVHVVGNQDAAVAADLQAVGPAVIFDHQRPCAVRRDPEDAPERNIDDVEIAFGVERRALDETVGRLARPVGIGPIGARRPCAGTFRASPRIFRCSISRGGVSRYIMLVASPLRSERCSIEDIVRSVDQPRNWGLPASSSCPSFSGHDGK